MDDPEDDYVLDVMTLWFFLTECAFGVLTFAENRAESLNFGKYRELVKLGYQKYIMVKSFFFREKTKLRTFSFTGFVSDKLCLVHSYKL